MKAVIAGYARSPFHFAKKGALALVRPDTLAAQVVKGLLSRTQLDPALLEDVILGCAYPEAAQGNTGLHARPGTEPGHGQHRRRRLAIGHPLGATGARITGKAAALLVRENGRYALATQCIGGGQGIATILEQL